MESEIRRWNKRKYAYTERANRRSVEGKDNLFFATNNEVDKTKWVMDSTASKHICRDREMFDTLKIDEEFVHFKLGNGGKMKVEGIGSVRMKDAYITCVGVLDK